MQKSHFLKVAQSAALKAGSYIKKNAGLVKSVRYKGEINIVTDIDKKAESIIVGAIKKAYPRHSFLAEEKKYAGKDSDYTWIIDPLDGTTNFVHGFPVFCVSIGLACQKNVIAGVVYDPTRDELFSAERNKGAFLNGKKIHVSKTRDIRKALLATGFAYNKKRVQDNNIDNFIRLMRAARAVRRAGSAAIDLSYVACGRFDAFWELYLHPWDTAAGLLLVEEAGGKVTKLDGSKYSVYDTEILASNSKIHSRISRILSN